MQLYSAQLRSILDHFRLDLSLEPNQSDPEVDDDDHTYSNASGPHSNLSVADQVRLVLAEESVGGSPHGSPTYSPTSPLYSSESSPKPVS